MKNLIFLAVLGVAGYFTYHYFVVPWLEGNAPAGPTASEYVVFIPDKCQREAESLKNAFDNKEMGKLTQVGLNGFTQTFRRCLRLAGFTDSQINEAYDDIKDSR